MVKLSPLVSQVKHQMSASELADPDLQGNLLALPLARSDNVHCIVNHHHLPTNVVRHMIAQPRLTFCIGSHAVHNKLGTLNELTPSSVGTPLSQVRCPIYGTMYAAVKRLRVLGSFEIKLP
jgi:hypothetical protein